MKQSEIIAAIEDLTARAAVTDTKLKVLETELQKLNESLAKLGEVGTANEREIAKILVNFNAEMSKLNAKAADTVKGIRDELLGKIGKPTELKVLKSDGLNRPIVLAILRQLGHPDLSPELAKLLA